jgi:hypothetical protein
MAWMDGQERKRVKPKPNAKRKIYASMKQTENKKDMSYMSK